MQWANSVRLEIMLHTENGEQTENGELLNLDMLEDWGTTCGGAFLLLERAGGSYGPCLPTTVSVH